MRSTRKPLYILSFNQFLMVCPFHIHKPEITTIGKNIHLTAKAACGILETGP